jgi:hypothetical protein
VERNPADEWLSCTDVVSGMAYESLFPARVGRPSGGRNLLPQARADCRSSPVRFLTCCGGVGEHADATRPPQAGRPATALPGWVLIVLVVGVGWVSVIVGALTGSWAGCQQPGSP